MKSFKIFLEEENKNLVSLSRALMQRYNIDIQTFHQKLKGGKADNVTISDIAKIPVETIIKGIEVEYEHTSDPLIALEIALDHLFEHVPESFKYYDYLEKMENKMENE